MASNRIWRQDIKAGTGQDEFYTYDGLYQLTQLQRGTLNSGKTGISGTPTWEEDFTYDPIGNWQNYLTKVSGSTTLNQNRTQNMVNETTSIAGSSTLVSYDAAGNMKATPQPANWSSGYNLTYDAWDRLVSVSSGGTAVATYAYDGQNRRTTKTTSATTRHYYYSAQWQILEERTGVSTSPDRQFVWGPGPLGVDNLVYRDLFSGGTTQRFFPFGDSHSITGIFNTSHAVQERYGYNAFGNTNVMNASFGSISGSAYDWEIRFCGYRWDDETNFYQVRNRYLQPSLGRWLSRDPIGEEAGMNLYRYVSNSPIFHSDPSGLLDYSPPPGTVTLSGGHDPANDPQSPTPPPQSLPGDNENIAWGNHPEKGKPCNCPPATLKTFTRHDTLNMFSITMGAQIQIDGDYKEQQIRWRTCWRIDVTAGYIRSCDDQTSCTFARIDISASSGYLNSGTYVTNTFLQFLSCEKKVWTLKEYSVGATISPNGNDNVGPFINVPPH